MPSPTRLPENHFPGPRELLAVVIRRPGISLRELCGELWPDLRWRGLRRADDSAAERIRGNGKTAADTVLETMMVLVSQGEVWLFRRKDEVDRKAAMAFCPTSPQQVAIPQEEDSHLRDGRRRPYLPGERERRPRRKERQSPSSRSRRPRRQERSDSSQRLPCQSGGESARRRRSPRSPQQRTSGGLALVP